MRRLWYLLSSSLYPFMVFECLSVGFGIERFLIRMEEGFCCIRLCSTFWGSTTHPVQPCFGSQRAGWTSVRVGVGGTWLRTECFICGAGTGQEEKWTTSQAVVAQGKDSGKPGLRHRVVFGMLRWSPKRKARCFENGICYAFAQVVIEAPSKYVLFHFFCG